MKTFRKTLVACLAVLLLVPALAGCSKSSTAIELETKEEIWANATEEVSKFAQGQICQLLMQVSYDTFEQYRAEGNTLISIPFDNDLGRRWKDFTELHGQVKDAAVAETEREEDGSFISHIVLTGEDNETMRLNLTFNATGDPLSTTLEAYEDDSNKTFGEKMAEAGMNTLVGLLVVFAVLVLLSLIISAFKYIGAVSEKLTKKDAKAAPAPAKAAAPKAAPAPAAAAADTVNDEELVAVIAAAIAASENTTTDAFVVRSIRRLKNNRW